MQSFTPATICPSRPVTSPCPSFTIHRRTYCENYCPMAFRHTAILCRCTRHHTSLHTSSHVATHVITCRCTRHHTSLHTSSHVAAHVITCGVYVVVLTLNLSVPFVGRGGIAPGLRRNRPRAAAGLQVPWRVHRGVFDVIDALHLDGQCDQHHSILSHQVSI